MSDLNKSESIVLGGGCFWCLEAVYSRVKGVSEVVSGYAGGEQENPNYEQVSSGRTGHAEVVRIEFDPNIISLENIFRIFFSIHDPTTLNRQGSDIGTHYRSIILYENQAQHDIADSVLRESAIRNIYGGMIVTELKKLENFYPAEEYHQRYFEKNPDNAYCRLNIAPKIGKFREMFANFFRK